MSNNFVHLDSAWIKINDAIHVIQHQFDHHNIICVCQQNASPVSILIHYISLEHRKLGISEQYVEALCQNQLILTTCKPTRFDNEWVTLKNTILKRSDYRKDICLFDEQHTITLYGIAHVVKRIQQQFESINKNNKTSDKVPTFVNEKFVKSGNGSIKNWNNEKGSVIKSLIPDRPIEQLHAQKLSLQKPSGQQAYSQQTCTQKTLVYSSRTQESSMQQPQIQQSSVHNLGTKQLPVQETVPPQASLAMPSIEKPCDAKINSSLKSNETVIHSLSTQSIVFDVDEPGFELLVIQRFDQLSTIVNSECSLEKQILRKRIQILIPKAKLYESEDDILNIESQGNTSESSNESNGTATTQKGNWFLSWFQAKKPTSSQQQASCKSQIISTSTVTIGKSKIIVGIGDLTKQPVNIFSS